MSAREIRNKRSADQIDNSENIIEVPNIFIISDEEESDSEDNSKPRLSAREIRKKRRADQIDNSGNTRNFSRAKKHRANDSSGSERFFTRLEKQ